MIHVIRLNGSDMYVNPDLILTLEETPDTVLTMTNGEKYVLKDKIQDVIQRYVDYKRSINPFKEDQ
jgi:flagellar protein FlbD